MMRDTSDRRQQITAMLHERGSVQVPTLAERFGVSTQTIRKDLFYLGNRGVATRCYGGAIAASVVGPPVEPQVETKRGLRAAEKELIGRRAAALISPGDSIVLDSGTTTAYIARHLPDNEDITVVINDANILLELLPKQRVQIVMLGGTLRRKNMAFYGAQSEAAMAGLHVDKLFLGVDGFHVESGITTHFENEALLNRKMVKMAREVIAVTDSSKFDRVCLHRIIDIDELDLLITDANASPRVIDAVRRAGVEVVQAD